jgi:hypothetical protein
VYRTAQAQRGTDELISYQSALLELLRYWPRVLANTGDAIVYRANKDELAFRFARESIHDQVGYDS